MTPTQYFAPPAETLCRDTWLFMEELIDSLADQEAICQGAQRRQLATRLRALHDVVVDDPHSLLGGPPARARAAVALARLCEQIESRETPPLTVPWLSQIQHELHRAVHGAMAR